MSGPGGDGSQRSVIARIWAFVSRPSVRFSLGTLVVAARRERIGSPAVLIVGDVLRGCAALAARPASARSARV